MFIISLYHIKLIPLPHNLQNYLYGQNQINHINGFRTLILGGWLPQWFEPLLPDALPCRAAQIDWPIKQGYRFADGNVACVRQLLGKTFLGGRHQWPADPPRPTRPGRGRKPIMDCTDEEVVRKAVEQDRQSVRKAREAWQKATGKEASDLTFKRFLSALAQDISE